MKNPIYDLGVCRMLNECSFHARMVCFQAYLRAKRTMIEYLLTLVRICIDPSNRHLGTRHADYTRFALPYLRQGNNEVYSKYLHPQRTMIDDTITFFQRACIQNRMILI